VEFPPATAKYAGIVLPGAGGGYFRLFPYWWTQLTIRNLERSQHPATCYFHPYEIDDEELKRIPHKIPMSLRISQFTNRKTVKEKFKRLLKDFRFTTMINAWRSLNRDEVPVALDLAGRGYGGARVLIGEDGVERLARDPSIAAEQPLPDALRAIPLTLCAHAARVTLRASELADLACGDVVMPERCALTRDGGTFAGQVWLHAIGGRGGWRCSARGDQLTVDGLDATGERDMSEGKRIETQTLDTGSEALRAAADAPIELCLELARFTLPLAELSALRPGEMLCTGRAIGELVTLSAGGRAFARGELCEVEGEIGVRVTELMG